MPEYVPIAIGTYNRVVLNEYIYFRGVTVGGAGGAIATPPFGRIEGAAGSGGAPP